MTVTDVRAMRAEQIASYESLEGAVRAVSRLVELQYPPEVVAISPRQFHVVDRSGLAARLRRGLTIGALVVATGVGAVSTVVALGFAPFVTSVVLPTAIAALAGGLAGVAVVLVQRRLDRDPWSEPPPELFPTAFDVVVSRDAEGAGHDLAQWWDPRARPAAPSPAG